MPHKPWRLLLSFGAASPAWAIVTLFTLTADSYAQEILQPHAPPILHSFLDSANVYPESVTVDQSSGSFFVGSVKEGTIYTKSCYLKKYIERLSRRLLSTSEKWAFGCRFEFLTLERKLT